MSSDCKNSHWWTWYTLEKPLHKTNYERWVDQSAKNPATPPYFYWIKTNECSEKK